MTLKNQPNKKPTRKVWAVIITGAILGGINAAIGIVVPDADYLPLLQEFSPYIIGIIMAISGYMTRDKE